MGDMETADLLKSIDSLLNQRLNQFERKLETAKTKQEEREFYLVKQKREKTGFVYCVKYIDPQTRKILPTKFSTGTNDKVKAFDFARLNKTALIESYFQRNNAELSILENYYAEGSKMLADEVKETKRVIGDKTRKIYDSFIKNRIVPFLKDRGIRYLTQIDTPTMKALKVYLNSTGLKPQSINNQIQGLKMCFRQLIGLKIMTDSSIVENLSVNGGSVEKEKVGVYPIPILKGVFDKQWNNQSYRLLDMMIYFMDLRNNEIAKIQLDDFEKVNGVMFLNVRGTKTENAPRLAPVSNYLYKEVLKYVKENDIPNDKPLFRKTYNDFFRKAYKEMGRVLGYTESQLSEKNITFYSGRHTYKSILALGYDKVSLPVNFQELFMGHTLKGNNQTSSIEKNYKHLDRKSVGDVIYSQMGKVAIDILEHYYLD
jgi:integrase